MFNRLINAIRPSLLYPGSTLTMWAVQADAEAFRSTIEGSGMKKVCNIRGLGCIFVPPRILHHWFVLAKGYFLNSPNADCSESGYPGFLPRFQ